MKKNGLLLIFLVIASLVLTVSAFAAAKDEAVPIVGGGEEGALANGPEAEAPVGYYNMPTLKSMVVTDTAYAYNSNPAAWGWAFNINWPISTYTQCVVINYTGEVRTSVVVGTVAFAAAIDNVLVSPANVDFDPPRAGYFTMGPSFTWVKCGLVPGTHNVKILFRPLYSGRTATVGYRSLHVQYRN